MIKRKSFLLTLLLLLGQLACTPKMPNTEEAIAFFADFHPGVSFSHSLRLELRSPSPELEEQGILSVWVTNDTSELLTIILPEGVSIYAFHQERWMKLNNQMQYITEEGGLRMYPNGDPGYQHQASIRILPQLSDVESGNIIRVVVIAAVGSGAETPVGYIGSYLDFDS